MQAVKGPTRFLLPTPDDAVHAALADVQTLPPEVACYTRYIWLPGGTKDEMRRASFTLNVVSRSPVLTLPPPIAGGILVRVDLRGFAPRHADLDDWLRLWDGFQYDPAFALLITHDTLKFATLLDPEILHRTVETVVSRRVEFPGKDEPDRTERIIVDHPGGDYVYPDGSGTVRNMRPGHYYVDLHWKGKHSDGDYHETLERVSVSVQEALADPRVAVLRLDSPAIEPSAFVDLQAATHSLAPVVSLPYFEFRALRQIQDDKESKVFSTIFGGRYYALTGIRKAKDVFGQDTKVTDQELFFQDFLGINRKDAAHDARDLFDRLRSDQRTLQRRSGVTGQPRITSFFAYPGAPPWRSGGGITFDPKDADVDLGDRAHRNLLNPRFRGQEGIFPKANGMPVCIALNNDGALVDEVPFDIAADRTIPAPNKPRLQAFDSCMRCHGPYDFWQPSPNSVKTATRGPGGIDIFGDLSNGHYAFDPDTNARLAGLYAGDLTEGLRRARDDFASAILRCVGVRPGAGDQSDAGRWACRTTGDDIISWWYDPVTPRQALRELGLDVPEGEAKDVLARVLRPLKAGYDPRLGFVPEDADVGYLKAGEGLNRSDWSLVYSPLAARSRENVKREVVRP